MTSKLLNELKILSSKGDKKSAIEWVTLLNSIDSKEYDNDPKINEYIDQMSQSFIYNCSTTEFNEYVYKLIFDIPSETSI